MTAISLTIQRLLPMLSINVEFEDRWTDRKRPTTLKQFAFNLLKWGHKSIDTLYNNLLASLRADFTK